MKHGILAQAKHDSTTYKLLYTFTSAATYRLFVNGALDVAITPNKNTPDPSHVLLQPDDKHLASAGNTLWVKGQGNTLLEGVEA